MNDRLRGHVDVLLLSALEVGPAHGYGLAELLRERSGGKFDLPEGTIYPSLYRLERKGWVDAEWGTSDLGRRAKLYRLTDAGRKQLAAEMATWKTFAAGVSKVLFST